MTFAERDRHRMADGDVRHRGPGRRPDRPTSCPTPRRTATTPSSRTASRAAGVDADAADGRGRLRRHAGRRLRRRRAASRAAATRTPTTSSTSLFTSTDDSPLTATNQWPLAGLVLACRATTTISATVLQAGGPASSAASRSRTPTAPRVAGHARRTTRPPGRSPSPRALALAGFVTLHGDRWPAPTRRATRHDRQDLVVHDREAAGRPGVCPCSLFDDATVPTLLAGRRHRPGHARRPVQPATSTGTVTGVRFYKGVNNTGTHTGALWSASGHHARAGHLRRRVDAPGGRR